MKKVLYPGSFDPITKGHMNIINQASRLFDEVIIAVMKNNNKKSSFFTISERVKIIRKLYKDNPNIKVITGEGATCDIALKNGCYFIVRGLRSLSDYNYEVELNQFNKEISNNQVNTICFFADREYQFTSSSGVKEVYSLKKDISHYVDPYVLDQMKKKDK